MSATLLIKWLKKQVKNTLFTRKTKNTTSANSSTSQKDVRFNISHYNSITDCPIWNYNQAIEKNDSRYLYILYDYSKLPDKKINHIMDKLFWEYMDEKGYDTKFKLAYDYKIRLADLKFKEAQGQDVRIDIIETERDLQDLFRGKNQRLSEQLAILSKFMGYQLDPRKITVYDFLGIEKMFIEHGKELTTKR